MGVCVCCGVGYILSREVKCMITVCVPATCTAAFTQRISTYLIFNLYFFLYWAKFVLILQVYMGDDDDNNDGFPEFILCGVRVLGALPVARRRNSPDTPPSSSSCRWRRPPPAGSRCFRSSLRWHPAAWSYLSLLSCRWHKHTHIIRPDRQCMFVFGLWSARPENRNNSAPGLEP